jgi:hypothetical protein
MKNDLVKNELDAKTEDELTNWWSLIANIGNIYEANKTMRDVFYIHFMLDKAEFKIDEEALKSGNEEKNCFHFYEDKFGIAYDFDKYFSDYRPFGSSNIIEAHDAYKLKNLYLSNLEVGGIKLDNRIKLGNRVNEFLTSGKDIKSGDNLSFLVGLLKNLENVYFRNNGILSLHNLHLPNLKVLDIRDNNINESDIKEFKSKHPQCRIHYTIKEGDTVL